MVCAEFDAEALIADLPPEDRLVQTEHGWRLEIPATLRNVRGQTVITNAMGRRVHRTGAIDQALADASINAYRWQRKLLASDTVRIVDLARAEGINPSHFVRLLRLAYLAPDLQRLILEGRQPPGLRMDRVRRADIPLSWVRQRQALALGGD